MEIVRFYNGCNQQSKVQVFEEMEQRTIAILLNSNELINMIDIRNINRTRSGYQAEI